MSFKKIEAFVKTAQLGSLTKAADAVGMTQSRVSHIIRDLEQEYGFSLMQRSRGGVQLTQAGQQLLPLMQEILLKKENLDHTVEELRSAGSGSIQLGAFTSVAVHWLPGILQTFSAAHPQIEIKLFNGDYYDVDQWLRSGSINIAFITLPAPAGMQAIPLAEDPLVAILPKGHRLASFDAIPLKELEKESFISLPDSSAHDIHRALGQAGFQPNVKFTTRDDYAILAMVEQGLGISIVPRLLLQGDKRNLEVRPLCPEAHRTIALAIPQNDPLPVVDAFITAAVKWVQTNK